jgi:hypothetical protein
MNDARKAGTENPCVTDGMALKWTIHIELVLVRALEAWE